MIAFYISGHGFGHASRSVTVINALRERRPGLPVLVCTNAPPTLITPSVTEPVTLRALECDTGLAQIDSLRADEAGSLRRAAAFHADLPDKARREADVLRAYGVRLVVGDIPPLAFAAAAAAGLKSVAVANFTWDWIYEGFPEYDVLIAGMRRYTRSEFIEPEVLRTGEWGPYLDRLLAKPAPIERPRVDGADVAAEMILEVGELTL